MGSAGLPTLHVTRKGVEMHAKGVEFHGKASKFMRKASKFTEKRRNSCERRRNSWKSVEIHAKGVEFHCQRDSDKGPEPHPHQQSKSAISSPSSLAPVYLYSKLNCTRLSGLGCRGKGCSNTRKHAAPPSCRDDDGRQRLTWEQALNHTCAQECNKPFGRVPSLTLIIRVRVGTAYDIQGRTRSRTLFQGRRCLPSSSSRKLPAAETLLGGIFTIKYDKSLRRCEMLIGHYLESEGNATFYLFAL